MPASYPTSAPTFTTKTDGVDDVQSSHMNAVQDEIAAMGAELVAGWTSYAPAWTAATANPALGDGTLTGRYHKVGKLVVFEISLTYGTTTTPGTGGWRFSLPTTSATGGGSGSFPATLVDTGTRYYTGVRGRLVSTTTLNLYFETDGEIGAGVPFVWANTDVLIVTGFYIET